MGWMEWMEGMNGMNVGSPLSKVTVTRIFSGVAGSAFSAGL